MDVVYSELVGAVATVLVVLVDFDPVVVLVLPVPVVLAPVEVTEPFGH